MLRAHVPETAVDEDRDLEPGEDDVWPDADAAGQVEPVIFAVAVAEPMQRTAESDLRFRVRAAVGTHVPGPALVHRLGLFPLAIPVRSWLLFLYLRHSSHQPTPSQTLRYA